jgi:hypothetical protein
MEHSNAAGKRLLAAALGTAAAAALGFAGWRAFARASPREMLVKANEYNAAVSDMYVAGPPEGPPVLLKPNYRLDDWVATNSLGLRAPEPAAVKSVPRVLVLGDSFTFGYGLKEGEAFCQVLGKALTGRAEVYNAGVSGYEIQDSVAQYFRVADRLEPDAVVVAFVTNDLNDSYASNEKGLMMPPRIGELPTGYFASSSNVLRLATAGGLDSQAFPEFVAKHGAGQPFFLMGLGPFARSRWERYARELDRVVADARKRGAKVLCFAFDPPRHVAVRRLGQACAATGVPLYSLGDAATLGDPRYHLTWDPHPNGLANAAMARVLLGALVTEGIVPETCGAPVKPVPVPDPKAVDAECFDNARNHLKHYVSLTAGGQENLNQVLAGFEDTAGLLGARAVIALGAPVAVSQLVVTARLADFLAESRAANESHAVAIRVGSGAPASFAVGRERRELVVPLTPAAFESTEGISFAVCEVDLRDPAVEAAPSSHRRRALAIRIERVELRP